MSDAAELTYERLKPLHVEFADFRRDLASVKMRLGSVEQHMATMAGDRASVHGDIARINLELDHIRGGVGLIKRRLDLAEA